MYFFQRPFTLQRGVKDIKGSGIPSPLRGVSLQGVNPLPHDAPHFSFKGYTLVGIQKIEKLVVACHPFCHAYLR